MEPVHYFVAEKNAHHGEAIVAGFRARREGAGRKRPVRGPKVLHLVGGLQHGSLEVLQQVLERREPYVFFDRAYFGGGYGTDRLRVVPNAYQHHWLGERRDPGRLNSAFGVRLQPWQGDGRHIMVVPPSAAVVRLFGLGRWEEQMLARLRACTKRPVMVSRKDDRDQVPLERRLAECHCVVTWTSNVAVDAILAGVPAFVSAHSAARPVAGLLGDLEAQLERPPRPERLGWAAALAWGQFGLAEIKSGLAREITMEHFR